MTRFALFIGLMSGCFVSNAQNISVTFTGTGAATAIDSITATNLATGQSVTLPGDGTLILNTNTGIPWISELTNPGMVFPNPFSGRATFSTRVQKPQTAYLNVVNQIGQLIVQTKSYLEAGQNEFSISLNQSGIYLITVTTDNGTDSYKVICTEPTSSQNTIQYLGTPPNPHNNHNSHNNHNHVTQPELKSSSTSYTLSYTAGQTILYRCTSGIYKTIVTDSPSESKNYEVEFIACTDSDRRNYAVVKIGNQTWMAENLAWLPSVGPSALGTEFYPRYYVYGYNGPSVTEAKSTGNYAVYGTLYNWQGALTACPKGWHLPGDPEWTLLSDFLTGNGYGYGGSGSDVAKSLAATSGWYPDSKAGAIGNDQAGNNRTGFSALPGGIRDYSGDVHDINHSAYYWSSSDISSWNRSLSSLSDSVLHVRNDRRSGISVRCVKGAAANTAPKASFSISPPVGKTVTNFLLDASGCNDFETSANNLEVRWDYSGDGTWDTGYDTLKTSTFQYPGPGIYSVILEVKDSSGLVGAKTEKVVVGDGVITDSRDGHEYVYKTIGTQDWMIENLAWLPAVSSFSLGSETSSIYYVTGYDGVSVDEAMANANYRTYGVLYNWPAAMAACPYGWHLPGDAEWQILEKYLGMSNPDQAGMRPDGAVGGQLKSTFGWMHFYANGSNSCGFTALPGGIRDTTGTGAPGGSAAFWSSTGDDLLGAWMRHLNSQYDNCLHCVYRGTFKNNYGFSVRCVRNP